MTIIFTYFNSLTGLRIAYTLCLFFIYLLMFFYFRGHSNDEYYSHRLYMLSIFGMILSIFPLSLPMITCINCNSAEYLVADLYVFSISISSFFPLLLWMRYGLTKLIRKNSEARKPILYLIQVFWLFSYSGYISALAILQLRDFGTHHIYLWGISMISFFTIPATFLTAFLNVKLKDNNISITGIVLFLLYINIFFQFFWNILPLILFIVFIFMNKSKLSKLHNDF